MTLASIYLFVNCYVILLLIYTEYSSNYNSIFIAMMCDPALLVYHCARDLKEISMVLYINFHNCFDGLFYEINDEMCNASIA